MYKFLGFLRQFPVKRFEKGSIILHQGEVPPYVYVIKRGIVKSYTISDVGDEKPIAFCMQQEVMATTWAFQKSPGTLYFYDAFTECTLYCIPRDELQQFIHSDKQTLAFFLDHYITKYVGKSVRVNALEYSKAIDKIARTMQYLCHGYGKQLKPNLVEIELPLSQQDIANLTGLTRETTGMELKKLKQRGIVSYVNRRYTVKIDELQEFYGEDDFKDIQLRA